MKRTRYFIIIIAFFCSITACRKDFLEVVDKTVLLKEGYVVDLESTGQFMNGIYNNVLASYAHGTYLPYPEIMADNMKPINSRAFVAAYNWAFMPSFVSNFGDPIRLWQAYYGIIRDCSFVIEKVEEYRNQNPVKADNFKGQALAIRAMLHFSLANMFAQSYNFTVDGSHLGIPYIQTPDVEAAVFRQTVAEVYTHIIDDLNNALQLLPVTGFVKEVMNYQAAKALLARVCLFKGDYNNAKNLAVQILKDVPVMTANYPANLYTANETEALFRFQPNAPADNNGGSFMGYYSDPVAGPYYVATNDIAQLLNEDLNDKRSSWVRQAPQGWLITKFPKGAANIFSRPEGDHYQTLLRSSEMCLTAAETYVKLNMEDSARFYIDIIRKRANPSLNSIDATGTALLDSICKERRKEMAFDGLRMFDLLRWKKGVNRFDAASAAVQNLPYPSNRAIAALPRQDVELLGLPQNPDY